MNTKARLTWVFAVLPLCPAAVFALHPSPTNWPLGPLPFWPYCSLYCGGRWSWWDFFDGPVMLATETLVLGVWMRQFGVLGNLWRAALLYIVARVSETVAAVCLSPIWMPGFTWWVLLLDRPLPVLVTVAVCLPAGWAGKLAIARFLYRRAEFRARQLVVPLAVATAVGYVCALSWILVCDPHQVRHLLWTFTEGWR